MYPGGNRLFEKNTKQASKKPLATNWLDYIQDDSLKKAAIPVGPRFQAELPEWIGPPKKDNKNLCETESEDSKWLGTQVWPIKNEAAKAAETETEETTNVGETDTNVGIGKGRAEFCDCESRGSVECVRRHVTDERIKVQSELGPAFREWGFDVMGEEVSNQWTLQEQHKFESIVKKNPLSQGKSFLKPALAALPSHDRHSILSYYFNVYLPRRIREETGSGCKPADTDDEETSEATNSGTSRRKKRRIS